MQFKLAETYRYWWPVTVMVPDPQKPGKYIEQGFKAELEPLSQEELTCASEESASLTSMREITKHGIQQIQRVVKNWSDVVDPDGATVPFTPEKLEMALQHAWFRAWETERGRAGLGARAVRPGR